MQIGRWKLLERFDIEDLEAPGSIYLTRWNILTTPWFGLKLHHIRRSDADRALHTHPWSFATLILRGGYIEEMGREHKLVTRRPGSFARHKYSHRHRIKELLGKETWTLVVSGPKEHKWGFWVSDSEWVDSETYLSARVDF